MTNFFRSFLARKKITTSVLTTDSFRRWLRAHRPPWAWWASQSEIVQEAMAILGDEHSQDFCVAIGYAIANPELANAGLAKGDDTSGEETIIRNITKTFINKMLSRPIIPEKSLVTENPKTERPSFSGFGKSKSESSNNKLSQDLKSKEPTFLGMKRDN